MAVNSLLAGKYFGVNAKNIVIGNGAAELIEALMETLDGTVGFIRPTFEEYPHRTDESRSVYMVVDNDDFSYDENDIIRFFTENPVDNIVLINPDNPSGNYIPADGVQRLISWCRDNSVRLILDESFVDFCGDGTEFKNATFISEEAFKSYSEGLIVVKSISKSFGVPGIRLGILAGGNEELVSRLKKKVAIWNINSFGEFYMQIAEKYKKDYDGAMQKICRCREELAEGLKKVSYLRPVPSQANYIMCEVLEGRKSIELAAFLLERNIFIKDLTSKIGNGKQYIRLAVRAKEDNERLLKALAEYGRQA
jgi:histidinol-phosphate/aromatic aminotransferase/cobyric acid decarboxylase-like protein